MDLKNALNEFVNRLPDYFPKDLGNPNDLHSWMMVCYLSCVCDSPLNQEDVERLLQKRFPISAAIVFMRQPLTTCIIITVIAHYSIFLKEKDCLL